MQLRKFFLALEAVLYIASNSINGPVSAKEICARHGLPVRHLEPLLQTLVKAKLLRGMRGPNGGYVLARERRKITVADIYQPLLKDDTLEDAPLHFNGIIRPFWDTVESNIIQDLKLTSIEDLLHQAEAKGITLPLTSKADFTI